MHWGTCMQLEILVGWKKLKIATGLKQAQFTWKKCRCLEIENSCSYLEISVFGADRWKLFNWLEIDAVTFKIFQLAGNSCSSTLKMQLAFHSFARVLALIKPGFRVAEGECGEAEWKRCKGVNSITLKVIMYQRHMYMHRYPIINENKYRSDRIFSSVGIAGSLDINTTSILFSCAGQEWMRI